jgi:hypothetical protein
MTYTEAESGMREDLDEFDTGALDHHFSIHRHPLAGIDEVGVTEHDEGATLGPHQALK